MKITWGIRTGIYSALMGLLLVTGSLMVSAQPVKAQSTIPKQLAVPWDPQGNRACLECHSEPHTMVRDGQEISTQVDSLSYTGSVHGIISCTQCHDGVGAEHAKDPETPLDIPFGRARVAHISAQCVKCHAGVYEESYGQSFHGIAVRHGDYRSATCVDCHGGHSIQPSRNPVSMVSRENLAGTCGTAQCHPGAPDSFAEGTEHVIWAKAETSGGLHLVYKFFIALILFDTIKDGPIVMFELLRRPQR